MTIGYSIQWKIVSGEFHSSQPREGSIVIYDVTEEAACEQFLKTANMFGRKVKIVSVTEIDKPKQTKVINKHPEQFDDQPDWGDVPI